MTKQKAAGIAILAINILAVIVAADLFVKGLVWKTIWIGWRGMCMCCQQAITSLGAMCIGKAVIEP